VYATNGTSGIGGLLSRVDAWLAWRRQQDMAFYELERRRREFDFYDRQRQQKEFDLNDKLRRLEEDRLRPVIGLDGR
jgi:hypothetical protein